MHTSEKQDVINRVVGYYHQKLKETPLALEYLKDRGIVHPRVIDQFQIGTSDSSLSKILPAAKTKQGKQIRDQLKELGILDKKGQETFKGCMTVPIVSGQGETIEIYGKRAKDVWLDEGRFGFFNLEALESKELILCSSVMDALSFWIHGFENTLVSFPVSEISDGFKNLLVRYQIQVITFADPNCDWDLLSSGMSSPKPNRNMASRNGETPI
ncbi:hypothetical protein KJ966_03705 [bacterium]|nr:hypothetical protein [bacterium]